MLARSSSSALGSSSSQGFEMHSAYDLRPPVGTRGVVPRVDTRLAIPDSPSKGKGTGEVADPLLDNENHSQYDRLTMTLDQLQPGRSAKILTIEGGPGVQQRLLQIGLHPGDTVSLASRGAFQGPVLINVAGMQVALGRGIARRIIVSPEPGPHGTHRGHGHRRGHGRH